jgi:uncharacterized Zn finger protein
MSDECGSLIVCPYCTHEHSDSWEMISVNQPECEVECEKCGKEFLCYGESDVTYYNSKKKEEAK